MPIVITIHRDQFILRHPATIERVRHDIEEAVAAGGRLVVMGDITDSPEVLISPATPVRIDVVIDYDEGADSEIIAFDDYWDGGAAQAESNS
jgi:hypothetical protein